MSIDCIYEEKWPFYSTSLAKWCRWFIGFLYLTHKQIQIDTGVGVLCRQINKGIGIFRGNLWIFAKGFLLIDTFVIIYSRGISSSFSMPWIFKSSSRWAMDGPILLHKGNPYRPTCWSEIEVVFLFCQH